MDSKRTWPNNSFLYWLNSLWWIDSYCKTGKTGKLFNATCLMLTWKTTKMTTMTWNHLFSSFIIDPILFSQTNESLFYFMFIIHLCFVLVSMKPYFRALWKSSRHLIYQYPTQSLLRANINKAPNATQIFFSFQQ